MNEETKPSAIEVNLVKALNRIGTAILAHAKATRSLARATNRLADIPPEGDLEGEVAAILGDPQQEPVTKDENDDDDPDGDDVLNPDWKRRQAERRAQAKKG